MSTAEEVARRILQGFTAYQARFNSITERAGSRFAERAWREGQDDARERLDCYSDVVSGLVERLDAILGPTARDRFYWGRVKGTYSGLTSGRPDEELARTFYNSVSRRVYGTVGVEPAVEYTGSVRERPRALAGEPALHRTWPVQGTTEQTVEAVLGALPFARWMKDISGDAGLVTAALHRELRLDEPGRGLEDIQVLPMPFYRNKGAYLVGRVRTGSGVWPFLVAMVHPEGGIRVDAALFSSAEASIVFSFTRSYFHVAADRPRALVAFLLTIIPQKPVDELYTSLGYHKHGKTLLYRNIERHLELTSARFATAEGAKGLVMSVFALPSLHTVFKVIRDRFGAPKTSTRNEVLEKYRLVFTHDRVGRLADAHEFEHLEFDRARFEPDVIDELRREAAGAVRVDGDRVIVRHLYTERQVTPLNVYLRNASPPAARAAILDYGQAIRDLAAANIFTGDMLLKNFGVTRHGRVIFYDYDELCFVTDCNFRELPEPRDEVEEMAGEPWYSVGEHDVFPTEFKAFLLLPGELGEAFREVHGDLLTLGFWQRMQDQAREGAVLDVYPYPPSRRFARG
jgi:isocitrate dehydrogenase kinase/phosphatase